MKIQAQPGNGLVVYLKSGENRVCVCGKNEKEKRKKRMGIEMFRTEANNGMI